MCVEQLRRASAARAHNAVDARQHQLQFFRLRLQGPKQSVLRNLRSHRLSREKHFRYRRVGRIGSQIQLQQLQKNTRIAHRNRKAQDAMEAAIGL